jgi:hypothetical protein
MPKPATSPPSSTNVWRSAAGVAPMVTSMPISGRLLEMISARSATRASEATRTISDTATNITIFSSRRAKSRGRLRSFQVRTTLPAGSTPESRPATSMAASRSAASTSSRRSAVPSRLSAIDRGRAARSFSSWVRPPS